MTISARTFVSICAAMFSIGAQAQTISGDSSTFRIGLPPDVSTALREEVTSAPAAELRGLDKMSGLATNLQVTTEEEIIFGRLRVAMRDCRYPRDNPTGDAYVYLSFSDVNSDEPVFDGWMIASSPALVALDHARYDIWAIRCKLDNRTPSVVAGESSPRPIMRP